MTEKPTMMTIMLFPVKWKCFCLGCLGVEEGFPEQGSSAANRKMFPKSGSHKVRANQNHYWEGVVIGHAACTGEQYHIIADAYRDGHVLIVNILRESGMMNHRIKNQIFGAGQRGNHKSVAKIFWLRDKSNVEKDNNGKTT